MWRLCFSWKKHFPLRKKVTTNLFPVVRASFHFRWNLAPWVAFFNFFQFEAEETLMTSIISPISGDSAVYNKLELKTSGCRMVLPKVGFTLKFSRISRASHLEFCRVSRSLYASFAKTCPRMSQFTAYWKWRLLKFFYVRPSVCFTF